MYFYFSLPLRLSFFADQVIRKGEVSCCWICTACKDNEYVQDEFTCKACELGWWPDTELEGRLTHLLSAYCTVFTLITSHLIGTMRQTCWKRAYNM